MYEMIVKGSMKPHRARTSFTMRESDSDKTQKGCTAEHKMIACVLCASGMMCSAMKRSSAAMPSRSPSGSPGSGRTRIQLRIIDGSRLMTSFGCCLSTKKFSSILPIAEGSWAIKQACFEERNSSLRLIPTSGSCTSSIIRYMVIALIVVRSSSAAVARSCLDMNSFRQCILKASTDSTPASFMRAITPSSVKPYSASSPRNVTVFVEVMSAFSPSTAWPAAVGDHGSTHASAEGASSADRHAAVAATTSTVAAFAPAVRWSGVSSDACAPASPPAVLTWQLGSLGALGREDSICGDGDSITGSMKFGRAGDRSTRP
eukprot:scaffold118_cov68-Phaeocystis_antarctica.AAC.1